MVFLLSHDHEKSPSSLQAWSNCSSPIFSMAMAQQKELKDRKKKNSLGATVLCQADVKNDKHRIQ